MLTSCYECGKQLSDAAPACPHCGAPMNGSKAPAQAVAAPPPAKKTKWYTWVAAVILGLILINYIGALMDRTEATAGSSSGLPACDSSRAERLARNTVEDNQSALLKFEIIVFRNPQTISSAPERVDCEAEVVLSNTVETKLAYSFFRNADGTFVETKLERTF